MRKEKLAIRKMLSEWRYIVASDCAHLPLSFTFARHLVQWMKNGKVVQCKCESVVRQSRLVHIFLPLGSIFFRSVSLLRNSFFFSKTFHSICFVYVCAFAIVPNNWFKWKTIAEYAIVIWFRCVRLAFIRPFWTHRRHKYSWHYFAFFYVYA